MHPSRSIRRSWPQTGVLVLLAVLAACAAGCDLGGIFGANWNINVYIPLGLSGSTDVFGSSTASSVSTWTPTATGSLSIPLLGDLAAPADSPAP